jgi:uncharacterized membrane protein YfcA
MDFYFYLPIAQIQISITTVLILSFAVGVLSGIFGIGGGVLMIAQRRLV